MSSPHLDKTLLIRADKIGDLVVSLNADSHPALTDSSCTWMISKGLGWVIDHAQPSKNYMEISKHFSCVHFFKLVQTIRDLNPDRAIVFQAPWFVGLALFLARVPVRVGRRSQWHSFLFFNKGVRQKRSSSEKHESRYNWDLISKGLKYCGEDHWKTPTLQAYQAHEKLRLLGLLPKNYCVIHPGMMGSALNWPQSHYISLIQEVCYHKMVVITGTESDQLWLDPIREKLKDQKHICWMDGSLTGPELIAVLSQSQFVVAPSTGIIHLAAALKVPVVGFYSPRTSEKASRWGPLIEDSLIFEPDESFESNPNCMSTIPVQSVFKPIKERFLSDPN